MMVDYFIINKIDYKQEKDMYLVRFECWFDGVMIGRDGYDIFVKIKPGLSLQEQSELINKKIRQLITARIEQKEMGNAFVGKDIPFKEEIKNVTQKSSSGKLGKEHS